MKNNFSNENETNYQVSKLIINVSIKIFLWNEINWKIKQSQMEDIFSDFWQKFQKINV
jgi:hypothetical protein